MKQLTTLVYLLTEDRVCLGKKKRGFGEGLWNGYGGKVVEGETIKEGAIRELKEESEVAVDETALEQVALLNFFFEDGKEIETHVFFIREWNGEPKETEEMSPLWFSFKDIPYKNMWEDDEYWMPKALKGEKQSGKIWFDESGAHIKEMSYEPLS